MPGASHLKEHKLKHNFQDFLDSLIRVAAVVYVSSPPFTSLYFSNSFILLKGKQFLNKTRFIDSDILAYKKTFVNKMFHLKNRILKTLLIKKPLMLPSSVSYSQQSVLIFVYFQIDPSHSIALHFLLSNSLQV